MESIVGQSFWPLVPKPKGISMEEPTDVAYGKMLCAPPNHGGGRRLTDMTVGDASRGLEVPPTVFFGFE